MKRQIPLLVCLVVGTSAAWSPAKLAGQPEVSVPLQSIAGPWLVFETTRHDFGKIPDTDLVHFDFVFRNAGSEPLEIYLPLWGGTSGSAYPRSLRDPTMRQSEFAPGERGYIRATFNPAGKRGEVRQRITVKSNDPVHPEQELTSAAIVKPVIQFDPPVVDFGEVPFGQSRSRTVTITGMGADFKVNYASVSKGLYVTARVLDTMPVEIDGDQANQCGLELTINGKAPRGTFLAITTVRTASEQVPLADFNIVAEVIGDLQVRPAQADLGIIELSQPFSKVLTVSSRSGTPFRILKIDQRTRLSAPLQFTIAPVDGANGAALQVMINGTSPSIVEPITGTLFLITDCPTDASISVELRGGVRPPENKPN